MKTKPNSSANRHIRSCFLNGQCGMSSKENTTKLATIAADTITMSCCLTCLIGHSCYEMCSEEKWMSPTRAHGISLRHAPRDEHWNHEDKTHCPDGTQKTFALSSTTWQDELPPEMRQCANANFFIWKHFELPAATCAVFLWCNCFIVSASIVEPHLIACH